MLFSITNGADAALWTLALKDRKVTPFGSVHSSTRIGATFRLMGDGSPMRVPKGGRRPFVQPFPTTGIKYQLVASDSEQPNHPLWSPDGTELFYNPGPGEFRSVSISTKPTFAFGRATAAARPFGGVSTLTRRPYDITPDSKFVSAIADGSPGGDRLAAEEIRVVLNWFEELRARVPTTK